MQYYPIRASRPIDGTSISRPATSDAIVTLTPNVPETALGALIQASAPIRVRCDGSDPTPTVGLHIEANQLLELDSYEECVGCRIIAESTTATLEVVFRK